MNCGLIRRHLDAYVDGEVDPSTQIEFERHLSACAGCQESVVFARSVKAQIKQHMAGTTAPVELRDRIRQSLDAADAAGRGPRDAHSHTPIRILPMKKRYAIPLAAAAAILMVMTYTMAPEGAERASQAAVIPMLEDVVRMHSAELPADVKGDQPQHLASYFRNKVAFPVRPAEFQRRDDARLVGARLSNVREQRAAALYYDVGGRRVTVVVFRQAEQAVRLEQGVHRARMHGRDLMYQQVNGYVVPMRRQDGLTYAFTGDVDRQTLLRLAATARVRY